MVFKYSKAMNVVTRLFEGKFLAVIVLKIIPIGLQHNESSVNTVCNFSVPFSCVC